MHTHMHKPRETNQTHLKFLVIVLTWAGLMDSPAIVLDLPRVAIPGKILATKAISVQRLSFTVFFYPLGRAKALGLLQKSCMSSESCNIAMNVLPHFILSFHSETENNGGCIKQQSMLLMRLKKLPGNSICDTNLFMVEWELSVSWLTDKLTSVSDHWLIESWRSQLSIEIRHRIHRWLIKWAVFF